MEYDHEVTTGQMIIWCIIFLPVFFVLAPAFFLGCLAVLVISIIAMAVIAILGAKIDKTLEKIEKPDA